MPTSVSINCTSPKIIAKWENAGGDLVKRATIQPYNSVYGGQYAELLPNETSPGEWSVEFITTENSGIASAKFIIFPTDGRNMDDSLILKYFRVVDTCSETTFAHLRNCIEMSWSPDSPDPKSRLFL